MSLEFTLKLDQPLQRFQELLECVHREHDGVPASTHVFGDLEEAPSLILFQVEEEKSSGRSLSFRRQWAQIASRSWGVSFVIRLLRFVFGSCLDYDQVFLEETLNEEQRFVGVVIAFKWRHHPV